ncbi:MAG TPA: hypothetical protein VGQ53_04280 [Chitinophagaceae bacterium]|jgi:hypothetical protein|nr:hypothetical protein [Chitinophagaceae bacterium]
MRQICLPIFFLALVSCKKELSNSEQTKQDSTSLPLADTSRISDTTIFFDVVIDGQRQLQIQPLNNYAVYWTGVVPYTSGSYGLYEQGIMNNADHGIILVNGNILLDPGDTSLLLKNKRMFNGFDPGDYPFTQNPDNSTGVQVHWIDQTGKTWGSDFGLADQSISMFQIINRINLDTSYNATGITHGIYVRCAFNCVLYDNSGNTIELKNGRLGISVWL